MPLKTAMRIGNMWIPEEYPIGVPLPLDFTAVQAIDIDLELEQTSHGIDFVQTIYVRNTANPQTLTLTFPGGQIIDIPAGASGYYPAVCAWGKFTMHAATTGGVAIQCLLMNVPVASQQWGPITINNVNANMVPAQANITTTKVVVTGASQLALAANANRKRVRIYAHKDNTAPIAYVFGAGPAVLTDHENLTQGQPFDSGVGPVSTQAIQIIGGNAGDVLVVQES